MGVQFSLIWYYNDYNPMVIRTNRNIALKKTDI